MAGILATQTLVGSVGRVYDLRTVGQNNNEVIDFTVAVTPRKKVGDDWVDGTTYWMTVTAWGRLAKNIAESFRPGDRVVVIGRTEMKDAYTNKDGGEVPARAILIADFAGLEVSYNPAKSDRVSKSDGGSSSSRSSSSGSSSSSSSRRNDDDDAPAKSSSKASQDDDLDFDDDDSFTPF